MAVEVGLVLVAEPVATQAVASGVRAELGSFGALGSSGSPRLVVDVLRVDEISRGIRVLAGQPHASSMSIAVSARGRVFGAGDPEPSLDTGDVRRAVQIDAESEPRSNAAAYDQALRSAAERAGRAIARLALGLPEPTDEAP